MRLTDSTKYSGRGCCLWCGRAYGQECGCGQRYGQKRGQAFSLIELILVLVILSIIVAITGASMTGMVKKAQREDTANAVLTLLERAKHLAAVEGVPYRLVLDTQSRLAWLEPADQEQSLALQALEPMRDQMGTAGLDAIGIDAQELNANWEDPIQWPQRIEVIYDSQMPEFEEGVLAVTYTPLGIGVAGWIGFQDQLGSTLIAAPSVISSFSIYEQGQRDDLDFSLQGLSEEIR